MSQKSARRTHPIRAVFNAIMGSAMTDRLVSLRFARISSEPKEHLARWIYVPRCFPKAYTQYPDHGERVSDVNPLQVQLVLDEGLCKKRDKTRNSAKCVLTYRKHGGEIFAEANPVRSWGPFSVLHGAGRFRPIYDETQRSALRKARRFPPMLPYAARSSFLRTCGGFRNAWYLRRGGKWGILPSISAGIISLVLPGCQALFSTSVDSCVFCGIFFTDMIKRKRGRVV